MADRLRTDNPATGIFGERVGLPVASESEHFYVCSACGQAVDMRDLGQVFHHEERGHAPIALDDGDAS